MMAGLELAPSLTLLGRVLRLALATALLALLRLGGLATGVLCLARVGLSRAHQLRTASSGRPGSSAAIWRHLKPRRRTASWMAGVLRRVLLLAVGRTGNAAGRAGRGRRARVRVKQRRLVALLLLLLLVADGQGLASPRSGSIIESIIWPSS